MLTVTLDSTGYKLNIASSYYYSKRIKELPTAYFDYELKVWKISRNRIDELCEAFKGELYFKTPLWKIKKEPAPDYSKLYEIEEDIVCPETKIPLYNYQVFGTRFMISRILKYGFVINSDGVGIGKTGQGIATMQWFCEHNGTKKYLIIAKKSIKEQWAAEIRKFSSAFDDYDIIYTSDTKKKREQAYLDAKNKDKCILITNYHNFLNDTDLIEQIDFDMALIDEAHCVKAHEGKINHNIGRIIYGKPTIFLTGTPIMSRPEDIFGIVQMAKPEYFGEWGEFSKRYIVSQYKYGYLAVVGAMNLDELRDKIQDVVIRRTEHEISIQMPDTIEKTIYVDTEKAQEQLLELLSMEEEKIKNNYDTLSGSQGDNPTEEAKENLMKLSVKLKAMISIKQAAATDPKIFKFAKTSKIMKHYAQTLPESLVNSPKTEAILDIVDEVVSSGEKVILFSKFVTVGNFFASEIEKKLKLKTLKYTGEENSEKRIKNLELFRELDDYNILIGSDAMAEGLNLAEARHVINIDLPDTYAIYTQRLGRARRVSSKYKNVVVYNILTKKTVDEAKLNKINKDKELDGALIATNEEQSKALAKASLGQ